MSRSIRLPSFVRRLPERLPQGLVLSLRRGRYALDLLLDRRLGLFLTADVLTVFFALFIALLGNGVEEIFSFVVLGPIVFLGLPILSTTIALERRSGSLDLALSVPSTERYFLRRVIPVCVFFTLQAWFLLHATMMLAGGFEGWREELFEHPIRLLVLHVQALQMSLLVGALALFWASRLISAGAVLLASLITLACLYPWLTTSPMSAAARMLLSAYEGFIFGIPIAYWNIAWNLFVITVTIVVFYLYARERLRRPSSMLS